VEDDLDGSAFFGLHRLDEHRYELPVTLGLCSGLGTLFGGSALGAAAEVAAEVTGRTPRWLGGQFLTFARPDDVVELTVAVLAQGRRFTQARVVGATGGRDVFHVATTLGDGGGDLHEAFVEPPGVEPPERCPPRPTSTRLRGTVIERMDLRLARSTHHPDLPAGTVGPGRSAYWARMPELGGAPAALAILGDLIPAGVVLATGRPGLGSSLDHSVRVHRPDPADWLLVDVRTQAIEGGLAHALAHVFDPAGVLRGTASQTTAVRLREATAEQTPPR
jgi:acyl-CoA thioesterase II